MGIYQRKDSPFWWMLLERPNQKAVRRSTGVVIDGGSSALSKQLRANAQAIYATAMADLVNRRYHLPGSLGARSFKDHRLWYATHVSTQKRGTEKELSALRQLAAYFDAYELTAIDQDLAREWRTWRLAKVSASTAKREEQLLRHLLATAVPKYLDRNPLVGLSALRVAVSDTRVLTMDEEQRLLAVLNNEDRALVIGALDTLLRLSNIAALTRRQDHKTYLFSDSKTGAVKIPISKRLRLALDGLPMAGQAYFTRYQHDTNHRVIRMFKYACQRAQIQTGRADGGISFHSLRHTGASRMLAAGVDVKTVMEIGGWRSLTVLNRYLHADDERKHAAVNTIGPT